MPGITVRDIDNLCKIINTKLILAIDPGVTTGIAVKCDGEYVTCSYADTRRIWQLLSSSKWDRVIVEDFITMNRMSVDGRHTIHVVGGVMALCEYFGYKLSIQTAGMRRGAMKDASALLHGTEHTDHEVDALAHLLTWERRNANTG